MVFGFGKKRPPVPDDDEDEQIELVLFQGATNGKDANLSANARLVQAGLVRTKELISDALSRRAEMIRLEPKGQIAVATFFVDGVPYPGNRMPPQAGLAITQMMKLLAGLDIQVRNKPQAGGIKAEYTGTPYTLRVNVNPLQGGGERLIVRAENKTIKLTTPEDLGFSSEMREKFREMAQTKAGVLLAAGPPMSGVTTMAFAMVRGIDPYLYTVYNLADTEGRELGHVTTFERNPGDTWVQSVGRAKRAEADVLYVDPIRNAEFCKEVFDEAEDCCFISEVAAHDAAGAIVQVREWLGDPKLVAQRLHGVIGQKLVRLLCRKCRQAYRPNPKLLAKVGLPPETKVLYRPPPPPAEGQPAPEPCSKCGGTGYFGRTGLTEFIILSDEMKKLVIAGGDAAAIKAQAKKEKMQTLNSDGMRLVGSGKTSLEELQRAFKTK
ncbi:MAG: ATPase, T2SS/T4P/T4SS family [Planctomycetaceae bacterium]